MKFGPITRKMKQIEIEGQCVPGDGCDSDCCRQIWSGDSSSSKSGCNKVHHCDSHWSKCS